MFLPPHDDRLITIIRSVLEENETADTADLVDVVLARIPAGLEREYLHEAIGAWVVVEEPDNERPQA